MSIPVSMTATLTFSPVEYCQAKSASIRSTPQGITSSDGSTSLKDAVTNCSHVSGCMYFILSLKDRARTAGSGSVTTTAGITWKTLSTVPYWESTLRSASS